jgi:hypothetical protein
MIYSLVCAFNCDDPIPIAVSEDIDKLKENAQFYLGEEYILDWEDFFDESGALTGSEAETRLGDGVYVIGIVEEL